MHFLNHEIGSSKPPKSNTDSINDCAPVLATYCTTQMMTDSPVSLKEIIAKTGIDPQRLEQQCSDEDILILARYCDNWKLIGHHLKLTKTQLGDIDGDCRTTAEKRLALLQKWKESFPFKATYEVLVESLLSCEMSQQACDICKHLLVKRNLPLGKL